MAKIVFEMDDAAAPLIIEALCAVGRYEPVVPNPDYNPDPEKKDDPGNTPTIANPVDPAAFARLWVVEMIRGTVLAYHTQKNADAAVAKTAALIAAMPVTASAE